MLRFQLRKSLAALLTAAALVTVPVCHAATGTVNASDVNFRTEAGTDADIIQKLAKGTTVEVEGAEGEWIQISIDDTKGYIHSEYLDVAADNTTKIVTSVAEASIAGLGVEYKAVSDDKEYVIEANMLNLRSGPGTGFEILGELSRGAECTIIGDAGDWTKIETVAGDTGFVLTKYVEEKQEVSRGTTTRTAGSSGPSDTAVVPAYNGDVASAVCSYALKLVGVPYVYGGYSTSGLDCSGFTKFVYSKYDISVPRSSSSYWSAGVKVSRDNLKPGDVVLFDRWGSMTLGHVGIYLGNDKFVHASTSRGAVVTDTLSNYRGNYLGARRVIQ